MKLIGIVEEGQVYCIPKYCTAGHNSFQVMAKTLRGHMSLRGNGSKVTQTVGQKQVYYIPRYCTTGHYSFQVIAKTLWGHMSL